MSVVCYTPTPVELHFIYWCDTYYGSTVIEFIVQYIVQGTLMFGLMITHTQQYNVTANDVFLWMCGVVSLETS